MVRTLAFVACVLVVTGSLAIAGQRRTKRIGDKDVILSGTGEPLEALVEVTNLRIYEARLADTNKPCCVVTGHLVSRLPHANFTVTLHFEVQNSRRGLSGYGFSVPVDVVVDGPALARPVPFVGCGPRWYALAVDGKRDPRDKPTYKLTVEIAKAKAPSLD
jgi:hypothetical protein